MLPLTKSASRHIQPGTAAQFRQCGGSHHSNQGGENETRAVYPVELICRRSYFPSAIERYSGGEHQRCQINSCDIALAESAADEISAPSRHIPAGLVIVGFALAAWAPVALALWMAVSR